MGSQELFERYLASSAPGDDPDSILETLLTSTLFALFLLAIRRQFKR